MGSSPQEDGGNQILLLGELKFSWLMGGERQMGGFRKFNEKWGKKVQNLGIIFQIPRYETCLYFMHLCVHCRELLFLLGYYAKYYESVGHKNILQMGGIPERG